MVAINVTKIERCSPSYVVRSPPFSYIVNSVVGSVVNAIFAVVGTFLNSFVLFTFWRSTKLRKKIPYFLIMVLSTTDLGVGLIAHPLYLVNSVNEIGGTPNCLYKIAYLTSLHLLAGKSGLTLSTMNIERYLSIVYPTFHRNRVTKPRCVAVLTLLGFLNIIAVISRIFERNVQVFLAVIVFLECLVTCFLYVSIFHTARRVVMPSVQSHAEGEARETKSIEGRKNTAIFHRDLKLAKMCFMVLVCCLICYLPNGIVLGVPINESTTFDNTVQIRLWATTLVSINSTLNCLIFFWTNRALRKEWRKVMNLE